MNELTRQSGMCLKTQDICTLSPEPASPTFLVPSCLPPDLLHPSRDKQTVSPPAVVYQTALDGIEEGVLEEQTLSA